MDEMSEFPITLTPEAVAHAKRLMVRKGKEGALLRVGVKGGGCSGYEYAVRFEDAARETDFVQEFDGLTVLVDPKSAELLRGATVGFSHDLLSGGFVFENPNASRSCGCGTSFTPKAAR
jgi:iron-sulfur cluster assembly protein